MKIGVICLVRGGEILRNHGPWGGKGPCLSVRDVRAPWPEPVGGSVSESDILRVLGPEDRPWMEERVKNARARKLDDHADNVEAAIRELNP